MGPGRSRRCGLAAPGLTSYPTWYIPVKSGLPISDGTKPANWSVCAVVLAGYTSGIHRAFSTTAALRSWNAAW